MNKILISSLVVGLLIAGLVFTALFTIHSPSEVQAKHKPCKTKHVLLIANEKRVRITDPLNDGYPSPPPPEGVWYNAMTWNDTIPGPVISVDQCDDLVVTVRNAGTMVHSLDFHAGNGPSNAIGVSGPGDSSTIARGASKTWTLHADMPGFFMYHCAGDKFMGIWEHIASGMYGGIVVHPHNEQRAKEFYVVFGEIYSDSPIGGTTGSFDMGKFKADNPDFVLTNGMSHKYVQSIGTLGTPSYYRLSPSPPAEVFKVRPGELTRWYIVNAGPNDDVAFHFISSMIDVHDGFLGSGGTGGGKLDTQLRNDETWSIPAGSGSVIQSRFPEEGIYVGVDHSMKDVLKGGAFIVQATSASTDTDHPIGTWVPPRGSPIAAGH
jgi:nitrite reductase (NO-forming)